MKADGLFKSYYDGKREIEVLKGVSLEVAVGDNIAIIGPSGAGKSTLLHILGGLDIPSRGRVIFENRDIYSLQENELARLRNNAIGFVFQFYHLLPEFDVLENVLLPLLIQGMNARGLEKRQLRLRALEILEEVGLKERVSYFPNQLSGGEQQRVAIARALVNNPRLLLCDEPTGNLDSTTADEIISLIKRLSHEHRMSVIFVTHNLELARSADSVFRLKNGILVE